MKVFLLYSFLFLQSWTFSQVDNDRADTMHYKIVVLGSSTAAGTGPKKKKNTWVNRYRRYVKNLMPQAEVINLAVGGYTTYHLMPSDIKNPQDRQQADTLRNITTAIAENPDIIIVNLPSNDMAWGYSYEEQIQNFDTIVARAKMNNIPIWLCTTQPRNFEPERRTLQFNMKDSMERIYKGETIDFWTDFSMSDHSINPIYDAGDGVHMNDEAHAILFKIVAETVPLPILLPITSAETINALTKDDELVVVSPPHSEKGPCKLCRKKRREQRKLQRKKRRLERKQNRK
ncbi:MAG: SGNH/GDSL hydrolase family protein [Crocinitomicaceae bacterium]|nr:SGNH/GDSL hydrolase family protein [Crocinitomicaceae bacterium]